MGLFRRKHDVEIDLTEPTEADIETVRRVRAQSPNGQITFGAPTRCPDCASYGYVEMVDTTNGRVDNTCPACRATWTINRKALEGSRVVEAEVRPIGGGILIAQLAMTA